MSAASDLGGQGVAQENKATTASSQESRAASPLSVARPVPRLYAQEAVEPLHLGGPPPFTPQRPRSERPTQEGPGEVASAWTSPRGAVQRS